MDDSHPPGFLVLLDVLQRAVDLAQACALCEVYNALVADDLQLREYPRLDELRPYADPQDRADDTRAAEDLEEGREDRDPREGGHHHQHGDAVIDVKVSEHIGVKQHDSCEGDSHEQQAKHEHRGVRIDLPGQRRPGHLHPQTAESEETHHQQKRDRVDRSEQGDVTIQQDAHRRTHEEKYQYRVVRRSPPLVCYRKELREAPVACHPLEQAAYANVARQHGAGEHKQRVDGDDVSEQGARHPLGEESERKGGLVSDQIIQGQDAYREGG
mmetsp:Transcript_58344/g.177873  ORF Transcript_58344/g.177873 Transcript_58344/m.177873 type:complete len:270 (-) Transcript_58344:1147-1956(-)